MEEQQEIVEKQILGVDPQEEEMPAELIEAVENQQEEEPQEKVEETAEQPPGLTPEQLQELQEKSRVYDIIDNDPRLSQMVMDYVRNKNGVAPEDPIESANVPDSPDFKALKKELELMKQGQRQLLAMLSIRDFEAANPDFKEIKQDVGQLLKRHPSFTLQEAYDHVKATRAGRNTPAPAAPTAAAEGPSRVRPSRGLEDLATIQKKVANRKSVESFDDAFRMAWEYAQRQSADRGE